MAIRFAVLFVASLAVASVAGAACLECVSSGIGWEGYCQPTINGRCQWTCCLSDAGTPCDLRERMFGCSDEGSVFIPTSYFATRLPLETEGSALQLQYGVTRKVQRKCLPLIARRDVA